MNTTPTPIPAGPNTRYVPVQTKFRDRDDVDVWLVYETGNPGEYLTDPEDGLRYCFYSREEAQRFADERLLCDIETDEVLS